MIYVFDKVFVFTKYLYLPNICIFICLPSGGVSNLWYVWIHFWAKGWYYSVFELLKRKTMTQNLVRFISFPQIMITCIQSNSELFVGLLNKRLMVSWSVARARWGMITKKFSEKFPKNWTPDTEGAAPSWKQTTWYIYRKEQLIIFSRWIKLITRATLSPKILDDEASSMIN